MARYFYSDTIEDFIAKDEDKILGVLTTQHTQKFDLTGNQRDAWQHQIRLLKSALAGWSHQGNIYFEYSIPRMGRRIDSVLLINGVIFVLEFKVHSDEFTQAALNQVCDYALDLKYFHDASRDRDIVPILIATDASSKDEQLAVTFDYGDRVAKPLLVNDRHLKETIENVLRKKNAKPFSHADEWAKSRYRPTPTIVEAACALYEHHTVEDIANSEAGENLTKTCEAIDAIIEKAQREKFKALCFVTGVPGAGKTLVGLNTANKHKIVDKNKAVYLSGNGPLVDVLVEALAKNHYKQDDEAYQASKTTGEKLKRPNKAKTRKAVESFIQKIHHYRDECLLGTTIKDGKIVRDDEYYDKLKDKAKAYTPIEHIAIFDEAQRAWTKDMLANFMKRKKDKPNFPYSEPEYLISCLDRHEDWAVIICLVGGGQEINTGEAGISEWIDSLKRSYHHWHVHISDKLYEKEYAAGQTLELLKGLEHVEVNDALHLAVSMRSFRAENLAHFVHQLLDLEVEKAAASYKALTNYPIVLTRSLPQAKAWLKEKARGSERYGMIVSSQAQRLKPLAIDVRFKPNVVHWFLSDADDVRSSFYLEDVATEFDVQGLELDWTCVVWDGDFRYSDNGWTNHSFVGNKWQNINNVERKKYQKNAYRVLLTRARQGMVLVVPEGNTKDPTRDPKFYDSTYEYLKSIGIEEI